MTKMLERTLTITDYTVRETNNKRIHLHQLYNTIIDNILTMLIDVENWHTNADLPAHSHRRLNVFG